MINNLLRTKEAKKIEKTTDTLFSLFKSQKWHRECEIHVFVYLYMD